MENIVTPRDNPFYSLLKTIFCFVIFLLCIWPLVTSLIVLSAIRWLWRSLLILKNRNLEFVKTENLRSVSYTPRNPGIVNIILHMQNEPNIVAMREAIEQSVLQRTIDNRLAFPKLTANLVSCWGYSAWKENPLFNIENHITLYPSNYRGRPITEANIQDYISNIVSKYLPPDLPPWQICVIPMSSTNTTRVDDVPATITTTTTLSSDECGPSGIASTSDAAMETVIEEPTQQNDSSTDSSTMSSQQQYYVIVRIHHLLLSEESKLRLSDFLSVESIDTLQSPVASSTELDALEDLNEKIPKSPLTNIITPPVYIPQLILRLQITLSNYWNEFLSKYDPYVGSTSKENSNGDEIQLTTLTELLAILLISSVAVVTDFVKGFYAIRHHPLIKLTFLQKLMKREIRKRNVTWTCCCNAIKTSLHPFQLFRGTVACISLLCVSIAVNWPHLVYREYKAFRYCFFQGHVGYPNTVIGFLFAYIPLVYNALLETGRFAVVFVQAPRYIYEELIQSAANDEHVLQKISMCGRKVLSWSEKVSAKDIQRACIAHNVSPTELYMSAASAALMELLDEFEYDRIPVPDEIRVLATYRVHDYLRSKLNVNDSETGHLCLKLPMESVSPQQLQRIGHNFNVARTNQVALYLLYLLHKRSNILTKFLPVVWTIIIFNYLSRRFTVSISEWVRSNDQQFQPRTAVACWGHVIKDAMYFSPPQSNSSVSLSIQQYGQHVQLGVITDAQIHPLHVKLSERWTKNLQKLFEPQ